MLELEQAIVKPDTVDLTNIQKRCADTLAREWEKLDQECIWADLRKYSPLLLVDVLSKTIRVAKQVQHHEI